MNITTAELLDMLAEARREAVAEVARQAAPDVATATPDVYSSLTRSYVCDVDVPTGPRWTPYAAARDELVQMTRKLEQAEFDREGARAEADALRHDADLWRRVCRMKPGNSLTLSESGQWMAQCSSKWATSTEPASALLAAGIGAEPTAAAAEEQDDTKGASTHGTHD